MWEFQYLGAGAAPPAGKRTIAVPGPWQAQFADLSMRGGIAVYRRSVELPEDWRDGRVFLHFGAVIGVAAQTADVAFSSKTMRRTGTMHCLVAFIFNTVVLALTINLLAGLF